MSTFFAPAARCLLAPARFVNFPVHSSTTSTLSSFHGNWAGSSTAMTGIVRPSTFRFVPSAFTSPG